MVTRLRPEGVEFVETAPRVLSFSRQVRAAPEAVFDALVADPASWRDWFPGLRGGSYADPSSYRVGARREVVVSGLGRYTETIMAFDRPVRWVYRVDETTLPTARALMEEWTLDGRGATTVVRWRFAVDPTPVFRLGMLVGSSVMGRVFQQAMRNLERRLWMPDHASET